MLEAGDPSLVSDQRKRVERELFLRAIAISKPPPEVARAIAQVLRDLHAKRGTILFERGSTPKTAHFVVSGEVTYQGVDDEEDMTFGPGSLIGILDLNIGRPRARTAVISQDAHLLELPYDQWLEVLEDFPDYTSAARRTVAHGLHEVMLTLAPDGGVSSLPGPCAPSKDCEIVSRMVMLRRTRAFETASMQAVADIADRGEILRPEPGELLVRPGGKVRLFMAMRGKVHVERRVTPILRATFGPGQLVMHGAAFSNALADYAVVCGPNAAVFAVDQADIDDVSDDHFDVVKSVLRGMSTDRDQLMSVRAKAPASRRLASEIPPPPPSRSE